MDWLMVLPAAGVMIAGTIWMVIRVRGRAAMDMATLRFIASDTTVDASEGSRQLGELMLALNAVVGGNVLAPNRVQREFRQQMQRLCRKGYIRPVDAHSYTITADGLLAAMRAQNEGRL